jgi:hypothetical protein
MAKTLFSGRQWKVTTWGVECIDQPYVIARSRLWENDDTHPWEEHMAEKGWVDMSDFRKAMAFARARFAHLKPQVRR